MILVLRLEVVAFLLMRFHSRGESVKSSCYYVFVAFFALDLEKEGSRTWIGFQEQNCMAAFGSGRISSDEVSVRGRKCQSSCYFVSVACFALDLEKEGTRTRIGFQGQYCIAAFGSGCISSDEVSLRGRKCQIFVLFCRRCLICSGSGERRHQNTDRVPGKQNCTAGLLDR